MVVLMNCSWYISDHLFNKFTGDVSKLGWVILKVWLLFIVRTDVESQEGLNIESLRDISNPLPQRPK